MSPTHHRRIARSIAGALATTAVTIALFAGAVDAQDDDRILRLERRVIPFDGTSERRNGQVSTITLDTDVLFAFDSAEVNPPALETLGRIDADLAERVDGSVAITIIGHTDSVGDDAYNLDLSRRRAEAVRAALGDHGALYTTEGRGEAEPVASNDTDDGRRRNRRVEIVIAGSAP